MAFDMTRREFLEASTSLAVLPPTVAARAFEPQSTSIVPWGAGEQQKRRQEVYGLHQRFLGPHFDVQGNWIGKEGHPPAGGRELLWNALSFLQSKDTVQSGNGLIRILMAREAHDAIIDHFINMAAVQILLWDKDQLEPAVAEQLRLFVHRKLTQTAAQPIEYLGYNDNFQAMETMFSLLGGGILDEAPSQQRGMQGLERALEFLERRGLLSEYTSPTYSPVSLLCFAEIAERAQSKDAASLALRIERRIWLDLALHFHAPTNLLAGPHSRAYALDSAGHLTQVHMVLYQAFGEAIWMTPARFLFPPVPKQIIHLDGDVPFMQTSEAWLASGTYHPDREIYRLMFAKKFPFRVTGTAEHGSASVPIMVRGPGPTSPFQASTELFEYPSTEVLSKTYLTEDFAIGTASAQFHDGNQSDAFYVNFRRTETPAHLADISTIFCRYTSNDHWPGAPWVNPARPEDGPRASLLADEGRVRAVQKDATALVLYQAKGQILDIFKSLRLTLVVPTLYRPLRAIWCGEHRIDALPFTSTEPQTIWLEDDFLLASFRPLLATDHGRTHAVLIQEINGYLTISFCNYEGEPKRFTRKDLLLTRNGFVAELSSPLQESLAAFRARLDAATVRDELAATDQRTVEYRRNGVRLSLSHSLLYDGLKFAAIEGKPQPTPALDYSEGS